MQTVWDTFLQDALQLIQCCCSHPNRPTQTTMDNNIIKRHVNKCTLWQKGSGPPFFSPLPTSSHFLLDFLESVEGQLQLKKSWQRQRTANVCHTLSG